MSQAPVVSGSPLFRTAAHQKSRIHADGTDLAGARYWSGRVFSVIYSVLMNPYPYPGADRIVRLTTQSVAGFGDPVHLNGGQIQTLRQSPVVESVLAMDYQALMLAGQDLPENVSTVSLTSNRFQDLGVPAMLGRGLSPMNPSGSKSISRRGSLAFLLGSLWPSPP